MLVGQVNCSVFERVKVYITTSVDVWQITSLGSGPRKFLCRSTDQSTAYSVTLWGGGGNY